jgi:hypothetical protein
MITVCPGCRQLINDNSAVMLSSGLVYHQRCAPGIAGRQMPGSVTLPKDEAQDTARVILIGLAGIGALLAVCLCPLLLFFAPLGYLFLRAALKR